MFNNARRGADMAAEFQKLPKIKARTGLSRSTIYARVSDGSFPAPVKIGQRAVGWIASEVDAWIAACIERSRKGS
jgi:prophage regulatory protein